MKYKVKKLSPSSGLFGMGMEYTVITESTEEIVAASTEESSADAICHMLNRTDKQNALLKKMTLPFGVHLDIAAEINAGTIPVANAVELVKLPVKDQPRYMDLAKLLYPARFKTLVSDLLKGVCNERDQADNRVPGNR